jgi:hypothetical protein
MNGERKAMTIWRRHILRLGLIAAAVKPVTASAQPAPGNRSGVLEAQDAWMDEGGSRHRMVFDTTTVAGLGIGLNFARNFYTANLDGYGIAATNIGTVIIVRHISTPFGYNDAIWAKYGEVITERVKLYDPRDKAAPRVNLFNTPIKDESLPNGGTLVNDLVKLGTRFAVCGMASTRLAEMVAKKTGGKADEILAEIKSNLVPNAVMVPAGIVALNRAQERGYTFSYCG